MGEQRPAYPPRRMRLPDAAHYVGLSESGFRDRVAPAVDPVRIGGTVGWLREDLDAWLDGQAGRVAASAPNPWDAPPDAPRRAPPPRP